MGTRSATFITGTGEDGKPFTVRLYRHWDGYPSSALVDISQTVAGLGADARNPERLQKALIESDNGFRLDGGPWGTPLSGRHYGDQGDLEWIYRVDTNSGRVDVFGSTKDFRLGTPKEHIAAGAVDPRLHPLCFKEEYVKESLDAVSAAVEGLRAAGFASVPGETCLVGVGDGMEDNSTAKTKQETMMENESKSEGAASDESGQKAATRPRAYAVPYEQRVEFAKTAEAAGVNVEYVKGLKTWVSTDGPNPALDKWKPVLDSDKVPVDDASERAVDANKAIKGGPERLGRVLVAACKEPKFDEKGVMGMVGLGADVNAKIFKGATALHKAAETGNVECVKALVAAGAKVDAVDDAGRTPLLKASWYGRVSTVGALVAAGADATATDAAGKGLRETAREGRAAQTNALLASFSEGGKNHSLGKAERAKKLAAVTEAYDATDAAVKACLPENEATSSKGYAQAKGRSVPRNAPAAPAA